MMTMMMIVNSTSLQQITDVCQQTAAQPANRPSCLYTGHMGNNISLRQSNQYLGGNIGSLFLIIKRLTIPVTQPVSADRGLAVCRLYKPAYIQGVNQCVEIFNCYYGLVFSLSYPK